ncbi:hypothetical protein FO519_004571 [Halicephalobus sp. NKZ332]|nr:hypothetical protein FO519_004571 [Halicephalobus sp. NKZ332]
MLELISVASLLDDEPMVSQGALFDEAGFDSIDDSEIIEMATKESSGISPSALESNKKDQNEVGQVKPIVIIAQIMMIYAFGALSYLALVVVPTIILIETACEKYRYGRYESRLPIKFECNGFIIPGVIVRFVRFFLISQLGFMIEIFMLNITKYSVGRLRPHFLAVCKPSVNTSTIASCGDAATYIQHYICLGKDQALIKDARLSFFSGHTSHAFYYAFFLVIYMHCRFGRTMRTSVFFPIIYALLISAAAFVGYSRVNDNKHHVGDVIAGAFIGILVAICMLILFHHQFFDIIFDKKQGEVPEVVPEEIKDSSDAISEAPSATMTVHTQTTNLSFPAAGTSKRASKDSGAEEFINMSSSSEEEQEKPPQKEKKTGQRRNSQNEKAAQAVVLRPKILNAESNV